MSVLPTVVGVALEGVISGKVWRMDVRRWVAAGLCVPLLALAGCSDDEPQAGPQDPSTTTPSQSGSVPLPPSASEFTERNAKQFVAYWIRAFNFAVNTGGTKELRDLALKDCDSCAAIADTIDEIYAPGGRIESKGWSPERFDDAQLIDNSDATVQVSLRLSPQQIYRTPEADPEKTSGGRGTASFSLSWIGSEWQVADLTQQEA